LGINAAGQPLTGRTEAPAGAMSVIALTGIGEILPGADLAGNWPPRSAPPR